VKKLLDQTEVITNAWTSLTTLPAGYRPLEKVQCVAIVGANCNGFGLVQITESGLVQYYTTSSNVTNGIAFIVSF